MKSHLVSISLWLLSLIIGPLMFGVGCASGNFIRPYAKSNYELNRKLEATVGSTIMRWEAGFEDIRYNKPVYGIRKELMYVGTAKDVIRIYYREYTIAASGDYYARPAFSMDLTYSISMPAEIRFQDVVLIIYEADQNKIAYSIKRGSQQIYQWD